MIASRRLDKDEIVNIQSVDCDQSGVLTLTMGEVSGLEDKNGNLELIKENISIPLADKVCRTCLNLVEPESCTLIKSSESDDRIRNMFTTCLPQINLLLTNDPVICQKCFTKLEDFHNFSSTCSNTENKLVSYCSTNHLINPINLSDVLKRKLNDPSEVLVASSVKLEDDDDNTNNASPFEIVVDGDADVKSEGDEIFMEETTNKVTEPKRKLIDKHCPKGYRPKSFRL